MQFIDCSQGRFRRGAMVVMDGRRCVAAARRWGCGQWLMTLHGGCWIDTTTNPRRAEHCKHMRIPVTMFPSIRACRTKAEARRWMLGLAQGRKGRP